MSTLIATRAFDILMILSRCVFTSVFETPEKIFIAIKTGKILHLSNVKHVQSSRTGPG